MKNLQLKHINNNLFLIDLDKKEQELFHKQVIYPNGLIGVLDAPYDSEMYYKSKLIIGQLNQELEGITLFTLPDKKQVDVEKLIEEKYRYSNLFDYLLIKYPQDAKEIMEDALKFGIKCYNQCLSDNVDKLYTEEDMKKAINIARMRGKHPNPEFNDVDTNLIIQSFSNNLSEYDGKFVGGYVEKDTFIITKILDKE